MKKLLLFLLSALVISVYAQDELKQANKAFKKMEYDVAVDLAKKATGTGELKQQTEAWYLLGQVYQAIARDTTPKYKDYKDAVKLSWEAYQKSIEIDPEKKYQKKVDYLMITFNPIATAQGYKFYQANDMENAFICYDIACKAQKSPFLKGIIDTAVIFYTGVIGVSAKQYEKAIPYLQQAVDLKYAGASPYLQLKNAYFGMGDSVKGKEILTKAIEAFSSDMNVLVEVINYYISAGITSEALNFLAKAKANDPKNLTFHFVEGTLYEKMKQQDNALQSYQNAIAIDPNYFNAHFNIGVMYYNSAKELYDEANRQTDDAKYSELKNKADQEIAKAEPFLETSYKLADPADKKMVGEALRTIYVRLNKMDKANEIKKEMDSMQ